MDPEIRILAHLAHGLDLHMPLPFLHVPLFYYLTFPSEYERSWVSDSFNFRLDLTLNISVSFSLSRCFSLLPLSLIVSL